MSGKKKVNQKIKIGVLHGAISNAGDFLIYERGKKLLENFCGNKLDLSYKLRASPINEDFDGLIILGGPLITRRIHPQSRNIMRYIENRDIPCICVGLGISREKFDPAKNYFLDHESIDFWRHIYKTSKLFSVRDRTTYIVLKNYGIEAELTGCPALFDIEALEKNGFAVKKAKDINRINKIAVTIPYFSTKFTISKAKQFLLTLYFLFLLKRRFKGKKLGLFFQHGYENLANNFMQKLASIIGIRTYDIVGKSLDSSEELRTCDVHIGTRLHSHIYFLSLNKPSFLFNVDMRTEAFLKTIATPSNKYTFLGVKNLILLLRGRITENNFDEFNSIPHKITNLYVVMKSFLNRIDFFFKEGNYENNKNQQ